MTAQNKPAEALAAKADSKKSGVADAFKDFPFYKEGAVPQYHRYHAEVSYLDELARIWGKPPTFIETKRGTLLLTAGFWGVARHMNYLGDLMMAAAWCLSCGFGHIAPYFYFIYFAPLLINRERRDDEICRAKYGADWDEYGRRVRFRIIPGIY